MKRLPLHSLASHLMAAALLLLLPVGCDREPIAAAPPQPALPEQAKVELPTWGYRVVNSYPHDRQAFTQGLVYHKGGLLESTGLTGHSTLREVELKTGRVLRQKKIADEYFAEGLALLGDRLYQLTWQHRKGFIWDLAFQPKGEFTYEGEGWGLTEDDESLILSDGTDQIRFLDPKTFQVRHTIHVTHGMRPLAQLNELEYVKGEILANIWYSDQIARIDPRTGAVLGWIDLTSILPASERRMEGTVLNGIAYDEQGGRLFVTGKFWPKLFEVELLK